MSDFLRTNEMAMKISKEIKDFWQATAMEARAENEKLREALNKIAAVRNSSGLEGYYGKLAFETLRVCDEAAVVNEESE